MFIVIYRQHGQLNYETKYYGPYPSHDEAYEILYTLPALGHAGDLDSGVKYIQELERR